MAVSGHNTTHLVVLQGRVTSKVHYRNFYYTKKTFLALINLVAVVLVSSTSSLDKLRNSEIPLELDV